MASVRFGGWVSLYGKVLLAVLATSASASAQSIVLSPLITRRDGRPSELRSNVINSDDCTADPSGDTLTFGLQANNASGLALEVWAGIVSECANPARSPTLIPSHCWQVAESATIPSMLSLNVRDILPHYASGAGTGTASVCETVGGTGTGTGAMTLSFLPMRGNMLVGEAATTLNVLFDLQAPEAPMAQTLTAGDTTLTLAWSMSNGTDAINQHVYCEPVAPDGCAATNLVAEQRPPEALLVAAVKTESSATVQGLNNQQRYACGVASIDRAGNLGPLSNLLCETPKPNPNGAGPEVAGRCEFYAQLDPEYRHDGCHRDVDAFVAAQKAFAAAQGKLTYLRDR